MRFLDFDNWQDVDYHSGFSSKFASVCHDLGLLTSSVEIKSYKFNRQYLLHFFRCLVHFTKPSFYRKGSGIETYMSHKYDDGILTCSFSSTFPSLIHTKYVLLIDDLVSESLLRVYNCPKWMMQNIQLQERKCLEGAILVVARSQNAILNINSFAPRATAICKIPPGVLRFILEAKQKVKKKQELVAGRNILTIGFIGKDIKNKNLDLVKLVVDCLNSFDSPFEFQLFYVGNDRVVSGGNIISFGRLYAHQIDEWTRFWKGIDMGILLSESEALGLSSLEYQYNGVPTIVWDRGGLKSSIVSKKTGLLLDYIHNPEYLANCILDWIKSGDFLEFMDQCIKLDYERDWRKYVLDVFQHIKSLNLTEADSTHL